MAKGHARASLNESSGLNQDTNVRLGASIGKTRNYSLSECERASTIAQLALLVWFRAIKPEQR